MTQEEKKIKNLGTLEGKLLFFGGVYSNLQALETLKVWSEENSFLPEHIFCTGDILGYCAQPVECIQLLADWNIQCIAGNVELQVRNDEDHCGCDFIHESRCDLFSKNWYSYIQSKIDVRSRKWLHTLPHHIQFTYGTYNLTMVHGSWFHTAEFIFQSTPWSKKQANFTASRSNIIIAGHCGLPFVSQEKDQFWLNPGVIGMPANDSSPKVWFATTGLEGDRFSYQFHQLAYNNHEARRLMLENHLPVSYADTLITGIWDNCEILPEEECRNQGRPISL